MTFKKGHTPWHKGKKTGIVPKSAFKKGHKTWSTGRTLPQSTKDKISKANKGNVAWNKGLKGYKSGDKHYNWKGGITPMTRTIRQSKEYKIWRDEIFGRDDFTCKECGNRGCYLEAHHIKQFAKLVGKYGITTLEEARICRELWELENGVTLCLPCHNEIKHERNIL